VIRGLARGTWATAVMTGAYLAQPRRPLPPQVVAENAARRAGIEAESLPGAVRTAYWLAAHVGFGATLGVLHERLRPRSSVAFGAAVWAAGYASTLPLLGLYPCLDRDDRVRAGTSLLAHLVFGVALGRR